MTISFCIVANQTWNDLFSTLFMILGVRGAVFLWHSIFWIRKHQQETMTSDLLMWLWSVVCFYHKHKLPTISYHRERNELLTIDAFVKELRTGKARDTAPLHNLFIPPRNTEKQSYSTSIERFPGIVVASTLEYTQDHLFRQREVTSDPR